VRFRYLLLIAGLIVSISYSCREKGGKYINQGEIHYNIDYISSTGKIADEFKPKTLVVSFKNDNILFEILSPIGNQGIMNIVNPEKKIYDTYINMIGVKYYYSGSPSERQPGFKSMEGLEIKKTSKTSTICGYDCNNAEVIFPFNKNKIYDIWYTNEIKVKNSNASTPFSEIDGVLLSFYYILGNSEMKFEAENVYKKDIPDKAFERRPKFKPVSRENMDKIIVEMVNL
jgi:hypothetical protein